MAHHRSHVELHETMVSGLCSCEAEAPSGAAEAAVVGGGDRIGVSEGCGSGDMYGRSRGCHCGSDAVCAVWLGWETWSATCSFHFVSGVRGDSLILPAGVHHCLQGSVVTVTGGVLQVIATLTGTSRRTLTVTLACTTWSVASRIVNCHCSASGASGVNRTGRQRCCGPRATWSATGHRTTSGSGTASWSASGCFAVHDAGCGAGHAGASQTPPGGRPHADCGFACRGTPLLVQMAWLEGCSRLPVAQGSVEGPRLFQPNQGVVPAQGTGVVASWAVPNGVPAEVVAGAAGVEGNYLHRCLRSIHHLPLRMGDSHPSGSRYPTVDCRQDHSRDVTDGVHSLRVGLNDGESLAQMVPWDGGPWEGPCLNALASRSAQCTTERAS